MVGDVQIRDTVVAADADMQGAVKKLVELANQAGGEDNITVVVVAVTDEAAASSNGEKAD